MRGAEMFGVLSKAGTSFGGVTGAAHSFGSGAATGAGAIGRETGGGAVAGATCMAADAGEPPFMASTSWAIVRIGSCVWGGTGMETGAAAGMATGAIGCNVGFGVIGATGAGGVWTGGVLGRSSSMRGATSAGGGSTAGRAGGGGSASGPATTSFGTAVAASSAATFSASACSLACFWSGAKIRSFISCIAASADSLERPSSVSSAST